MARIHNTLIFLVLVFFLALVLTMMSRLSFSAFIVRFVGQSALFSRGFEATCYVHTTFARPCAKEKSSEIA